jgi:hypothetical protein
MTFTIKGLFINSSLTALDEFKQAMAPEIDFEHLDVVSSVLKAVQYQMESEFQLCIISENIPAAEVESFFNDFKKLDKKTPCVFAQYRQAVAPDFERASMKNRGFDTVISVQHSSEDKEALLEALQPYLLQREFDELKAELPEVIEFLMNSISKVAIEKKRGKDKALSTVFSRYLRSSHEKFENFMELYTEQLLVSIEKARPITSIDMEVPHDVVTKNLPHLHKKGYGGHSHRVFDRMLKAHGTQKEPKNK